MKAFSFIQRLLDSLTVEGRIAKATELRQANKALHPTISFKRMSDMFDRRAAKLKAWMPNRIDGKVVIKTRSYLDIKRRFDPDHVKARLASATFKGVVGRRSWREWAIELYNPTPVVPMVKKALRTVKIVQPNTPRLKIRLTPRARPGRFVTRRQARKAIARDEAAQKAAELAFQP